MVIDHNPGRLLAKRRVALLASAETARLPLRLSFVCRGDFIRSSRCRALKIIARFKNIQNGNGYWLVKVGWFRYTKGNMATKKQKRTKTKAANTSVRERLFETDSTYLLKLVVFVLLGTFWLRFNDPIIWLGISFSAIPVGMLVGLLLVRKFEKYQADRKIWYAILILVTIISLFYPTGVII
jgi:hypothetical protein